MYLYKYLLKDLINNQTVLILYDQYIYISYVLGNLDHISFILKFQKIWKSSEILIKVNIYLLLLIYNHSSNVQKNY